MVNKINEFSDDLIQDQNIDQSNLGESILDVKNNIIKTIYFSESFFLRVAGILNGGKIDPDSVTDNLSLGREIYQKQISESNEESIDVL